MTQASPQEEIARLRQQLRESEQLLLMASEVARFGGWSADLENGRVYWSDIVCDIHEMPHGTVVSVDEGVSCYAPESREVIRSVFTACAVDGVPYDVEATLLTASGRRARVRSTARAERDAAGRIVRVVGAFQDIEPVRQAEDTARHLARRLSTTLESVTDGLFTVDREWRVTFINAAGERLLDRSRNGLLDRNLWQEFPQAVGSTFEREYRRAMREGVTVVFEEYFGPLERWFQVTAYPTADGMAAYFQDVTARRRAQDALRESEQRFRAVAAATNDAIWDMDLQTREIRWSDGYFRLFGFSADSGPLDVTEWEARVHPDDRQQVQRALERSIDLHPPADWHQEYRFRREDGSYAVVLDRGVVIRDGDGRPVRMVGGITDLSQQRADEARMLELESQLRQSQRLEAIGRLTGGVAHDFNNLLTVILGNSELLAERLHDDEALHGLAEMTRQAARRGAELTNGLLAFARRQPLDPGVVDVNRLIGRMDGLLRRTLGEDVQLETVRAGGLWPAMVDAAQLESALLNLAINARDAMPEGGRLTVETANAWLDQLYADQHGEVCPGQYVMLAVCDTGTGMAPEVMANAFEPFYTTKSSGKGSGLGLSMVYGFVKQSGGHVKGYSEPGEGTVMKLYLPRADEGVPVAGDSGAQQAMAPAVGGSESVLLVEDDDLVRAHTRAQLQSLGYTVSVAGDGEQALEILQATPGFDLLLTDVVMPGGLNGRQLADRAVAHGHALRVLFTSGYTDNAIVHHGRLDKGVQLLRKPFTRVELDRKVRLALDAPTHGEQE